MRAETGRGIEALSGILAGARKNRVIIQEFRPLAESLEWRLGQHYFQERGNKAFISEVSPIPFLVNNDGDLSSRAAELVFASVAASERAGRLEERIFVLELGIGVGLFARFFLDRFRDLSAGSGKDYYERLWYVAGDRSERMLSDASRHGIFADHPGRYLLRVIDATEPETGLSGDLAFDGSDGHPIRAVFLNYLLDCLPAAVLEIDGPELRQLCIRSFFARGVELDEYTHLSLDEVVRLANADDPGAYGELVPLYGLLASEYDYIEVDPGTIPFADIAIELARGRARFLLHNHGAIRCLARLHALLGDGGFILINDYGHTEPGDGEESFAPQRFSGSSAIGLNFSLLPECLERLGIAGWVEPAEHDDHFISCLVVKGGSPDAIARFHDLFGKRARDRVQKPVVEARAHVEGGRYELATSSYEKALRDQPWNWRLMNEIAQFLTFGLRDPAAGLVLCRNALLLNPVCSEELWSTLGDCLNLLGRGREGREAFLRALEVNPHDPRVHFELAASYFSQKDFPACLRAIANGFSADGTGSSTDLLLKLQADALGQLERRRQREAHLKVDRISRAVAPKDRISSGPIVDSFSRDSV
jgi:tetratricopeptide (TPR) repeat protein